MGQFCIYTQKHSGRAKTFRYAMHTRILGFSASAGQLGPRTVGPRTIGPRERNPPNDICPPRICSITEIQLKCILQMSEAYIQHSILLSKFCNIYVRICFVKCQYNLYVCIGYILPIIGRNMSVGGFLRALSGARLGNMYIL